MRDITYYDGLGRPIQEVAVVASGGLGYRDVVTPVVYDGLGRQYRDYLPYGTATGSGGAFKASAVSLQATYYNSPPAGVVQIGASGGTPSFGERKYEASPLNRVTEQGAPGTSWRLGSRTTSGGRTVMGAHVTNDVVTGFGVNSRRVARYGVTLSAAGTPTLTLATGAVYAAGELYVTITRDENWLSEAVDGRNGTVEEYADKQGRVRSEEHTSELQSLMRISYDVFCLKKTQSQ